MIYKQGGLLQNLVPKKDYFSRALHTIDVGQNDLATGLFYNMTTKEVKAFVPDVVHQITLTIKVTMSNKIVLLRLFAYILLFSLLVCTVTKLLT